MILFRLHITIVSILVIEMGGCMSLKRKNSSTLDVVEMLNLNVQKMLDTYAPDMFCLNSSLGLKPINIENKDLDELKCIGIMTDEDITKYGEDCIDFYKVIIDNGMTILRRDEFHKFIVSGRVWMLHLSHFENCETDRNKSVIKRATELWYLCLLNTYEANIYNPSRRNTKAIQVLAGSRSKASRNSTHDTLKLEHSRKEQVSLLS